MFLETVVLIYILYWIITNLPGTEPEYTFICEDEEMVSLYMSKKRNTTDSGVDLLLPPGTYVFPANSFGNTIKYKLVIHNRTLAGVIIVPRSSICKTSLRMSNSIGLIDCGYTGEIMTKIDNLGSEFTIVSTLENPVSLFQICAPSLKPMSYTIREKKNMSIPATERGSGGFGSTGRTT